MSLNETQDPARREPRWRRLAIPADDSSSGSAVRWLVRFTMTQWGLNALSDDVELCAGELLANAVEHATPDGATTRPSDRRLVTLSLSARPGWFLLEVSDPDSTPLKLFEVAVGGREDPDSLATCGRGLHIVRTLADEVSWRLNAGGGKTVCAKFGTGQHI